MKKFICLILMILLIASVAGCDSKNEAVSNTGAVVGKVEENVFKIETDYCTLKYPSKWESVLKIEQSKQVVSFTYTRTNTKVFDIVFGDGEGDLLGVLKKGNVEVRVFAYPIDETGTDNDLLTEMQFDVNVIMNHLVSDGIFELAG